MAGALRQAERIRTSSFLSKLPLVGAEEDNVERVAPSDLIPLLQAVGVDFVLAGAHGLGAWMREPRATQDVDFIIRARQARRASEALLRAHPDWEVEKSPDVWRHKKGGSYLADLMFDRAPLFKRVLREYTVVRLARRQVKIPRVEAALALKFAAMTGHYRKPSKKLLDAHDFMEIVETNSELNESLLAELGELAYPGGGKDLANYVADARAGRKLEI